MAVEPPWLLSLTLNQRLVNNGQASSFVRKQRVSTRSPSLNAVSLSTKGPAPSYGYNSNANY